MVSLKEENTSFPLSIKNSPVISNTKNALKVFSGSAHPELSTEIANYLGMDLGKLTIKKFADGEIYVQINESIRGSDVFLVQPTCPPTTTTSWSCWL